MKSVGEVMAIGRNWQESVQKALRGLETGLTGFDELEHLQGATIEEIEAALSRPTPDRLLVAADALRAGMSVERIHQIAKFEPWFLRQMQELVEEEAKVKAGGLPTTAAAFRHLKSLGFSDARLAKLAGTTEAEVLRARRALNVRPVFKRIDTCAAEFAAKTPYICLLYTSPSPRDS